MERSKKSPNEWNIVDSKVKKHFPPLVCELVIKREKTAKQRWCSEQERHRVYSMHRYEQSTLCLV